MCNAWVTMCAMPFQGGFQLFFVARDDDAGVSSPDHLENIFINIPDFQVSSTIGGIYSGNRVTLNMFFYIDCEDDYYGSDCSTFCLAQDNANGHYTCDEDDGSQICLPNYYGPECRRHCRPNEFYTCDEDDGFVICREGFTRPQELCTESKCSVLQVLM